MISGALLFLATQLAFIFFGFPAAMHPAVRRLGWGARISLAFFAGAVLLTIEGTLLSLFGISWGERSLAIPLVVFSAVLSWYWRKKVLSDGRLQSAASPPEPRGRLAVERSDGRKSAVPQDVDLRVLIASAIPAFASLLHLAASLWFGRATTTDFVLFWGIKSAVFWDDKGLSTRFLDWHYATHSHVTYPQLVPTHFTWSMFFVGEGMWKFAPLAALLWLVMAIPLVLALLRILLPPNGAYAATSLWTIAMSASFVASLAGGSAEPPLVAFLSVAMLALLIESRAPETARFIGAIAFAGALMTKTEGFFSFVLLIGGWLIARFVGGLEARRPLRRFLIAFVAIPLAAASTWWIFQLANGLPLRDHAREKLFVITFDWVPQIVTGMFRNLGAGTWGLTWIVPALVLLSSWHRWRRVVVPLALLAGSFAIYFFYFLHSQSDPSALLRWTVPRIMQPSLSALIFAAAIATFPPRREIED